MRTFCPTMDSFGLARTSVGFSPEANILAKCLIQSVAHYLQPRLDLLVPEIESLDADIETAQAAIEFAYCLPRFAPLPEVSVDPDGEISFDWLSQSGEMFSVSINKQNRLAYAGWFGEKSRVHGVELLAENCPPEIVRGIQKAML